VLIAGALFTGGWSLALAQDAGSDGGSPPQVALSLAYPVFDILLVSLVIALRFPLRPARRGLDGRAGRRVLRRRGLRPRSGPCRPCAPGTPLESCSTPAGSAGYLLLAIAPWM